ncbi:glycerol acyltransferase [Nostocoides sp. F2B08]|uniref:lysophospholipid acyltransferase family protein n=1 Tax=Nostocoides sp. F2B08 TaxID=2653936 RepID=UPI001263316D|nr:lysophospholipid acyltransferase family protein [Tetrasphaera sp. F2B08]KAB7746456.1 glycerol acyltransferase [Tetrasphaera sp. F2B08]
MAGTTDNAPAKKRSTTTSAQKKAAPNKAVPNKAAPKGTTPKKAGARATTTKRAPDTNQAPGPKTPAETGSTARKTRTAPKKAAAKKTAATKKVAPGKTAAAKATPAAAGAASGRSTLDAGLTRAASEPRTASPLLRATVAPPGDPRAETSGARSGSAAAASERRLRVVPDLGEKPAAPRMAPVPRSIEQAVSMLADALRVGAAAMGFSSSEAEEQVARTLAFLRRRATGDYTVDEFGFDEDFTENVWLPLLRPLYEKWFRVEVRGIENIPASGGALIVANHSGTVPVDGLMTQIAIHDAHPDGRHLRMLGADLVFQLPFVGRSARRTGSTLATGADAERLLRQGELVGVYPEGFKGVGKPFGERYKLQRFGRGGFVAAALRTGVPIVPCSIVGAEEIYPLIGNMSVIARLLGAPYFPVTPFFPLLGPLGLIPLPSKWIIAFGEPLDTSSIGPAGAEDPMLVFDLTDQVRETIQQTLYSLLMQRRSVFF